MDDSCRTTTPAHAGARPGWMQPEPALSGTGQTTKALMPPRGKRSARHGRCRRNGKRMLICQLTDLHVRPLGVPCNRVSETNMLTERACRVVARFSPRPDVVLITGDLTECGLPAEYENVSAIL